MLSTESGPKKPAKRPRVTIKESNNTRLKAILSLEAPLKRTYEILKMIDYQDTSIPVDTTSGPMTFILELVQECIEDDYFDAGEQKAEQMPGVKLEEGLPMPISMRAGRPGLVVMKRVIQSIVDLAMPLKKVCEALGSIGYKQDSIPVDLKMGPTIFIMDLIKSFAGIGPVDDMDEGLVPRSKRRRQGEWTARMTNCDSDCQNLLVQPLETTKVEAPA